MPTPRPRIGRQRSHPQPEVADRPLPLSRWHVARHPEEARPQAESARPPCHPSERSSDSSPLDATTRCDQRARPGHRPGRRTSRRRRRPAPSGRVVGRAQPPGRRSGRARTPRQGTWRPRLARDGSRTRAPAARPPVRRRARPRRRAASWPLRGRRSSPAPGHGQGVGVGGAQVVGHRVPLARQTSSHVVRPA